uniref:Spaetzle domain-containing protein n=1 Tax=Glossina brevipalpis TaxID=37001 RepID=A0A1A9X473_9MUSC
MFREILTFTLFLSFDLIYLFNHSYMTINAENQSSINPELMECLEWDHGFCVKMLNYPNLDQIEDELINEYPQLISTIDDDLIDDEIEPRADIHSEFLCKSHKRIIYPLIQKTETGWLYIVNNERLRQGVLVEECDLQDSQCNSNSPKTSCKQFYIYRKLVAMTLKGEKLASDFQIPSCCKCLVEYSLMTND